MWCEICGKFIQEAHQEIDGKFYHNKCIIALAERARKEREMIKNGKNNRKSRAV